MIVLERWQLALYHCVCLWHGPNKYFSGVCFSFLFPGFRGPLWVRSSTKFSTHTVEKPISSAKVRAWVLFTSPMYLMGPIWISFHPEGLIEVWSVWVHRHNVVVAIRLYPFPLVFLVLLVAAGRWQVSPQTQLFYLSLLVKKIFDLPGGQMTPHLQTLLFRSSQQRLDPWTAFWAYTAHFKGPQLALCFAYGTTEMQGYRQVCRARRGGPRIPSTTDANLDYAFFTLFTSILDFEKSTE